MSNPYSNKSAPSQAAAPAAIAGNPFDRVAEAADLLPFLPAGVGVKAKVVNFRQVAPTVGSKLGWCIYIDLEIVDVAQGDVEPGQKYAHRMSNFDDAIRGKYAAEELRAFFLAVFGPKGLTPDTDVAVWKSLPNKAADGSDPDFDPRGLEFVITTERKFGKNADRTDVTRGVTRGTYFSV